MNTEFDYGEIKNLTKKKVPRSGDWGRDIDGHPFVYTIYKGWKPLDPDRYEAKYWKKKYMELLAKFK